MGKNLMKYAFTYLCTNSCIEKLTTYSINPVGIRFTGSSELEPSARIVPTHLASWYMRFDLPCSLRWCIPWLVSSRKSDGTDIWLMRLNNWERILSCWLGCKLSRVCLQTSNTIERSPAGTTVGCKICISEVEEHSLSVSNFSYAS